MTYSCHLSFTRNQLAVIVSPYHINQPAIERVFLYPHEDELEL